MDKTQPTHGQRYSAALARVIAVLGDSAETLTEFNAAINAKYPRRDLIADEAEAFADFVEWKAAVEANAADHADLIDTQECARV